MNEFERLEASYKETLDSDGAMLEVIENEWCDVDALISNVKALVAALASDNKEDMLEAGTGLAEVIDKGIEKYAKHYMSEPLTEGMEINKGILTWDNQD